MTKIKFVVKEERKVMIWNKGTIRDSLTPPYIKELIDEYVPEDQTTEIEVYMGEKLIDDLDIKFTELPSRYPDYDFGWIGWNSHITIKKYSFLVKDVSDEAMDRPIIEYMLANDTDRACWSINKKPIDINNTFNHYGVNELTGNRQHHEKYCNIDTCDLITYASSYDGTHFSLNNRCRLFNSIFQIENMQFNFLQLFPSICSKQTMIDIFFADEVNPKYGDLNEFSHQIRPSEIDIYRARQITYTNNWIESSIKVMESNKNYVLEFFEENKVVLSESIGYTETRFVFVLKSIRIQDFNSLLSNVLPVDILDIIYVYADFESVVPLISDIFGQNSEYGSNE